MRACSPLSRLARPLLVSSIIGLILWKPAPEELKSANALEGVKQVSYQAETDPKFARSKSSCGLNKDIVDHRDGDGQGVKCLYILL